MNSIYDDALSSGGYTAGVAPPGIVQGAPQATTQPAPQSTGGGNWWDRFNGTPTTDWIGGLGDAGGAYQGLVNGTGVYQIPLNQDFAGSYQSVAQSLGYTGDSTWTPEYGDASGGGSVNPAFEQWLQSRNAVPVMIPGVDGQGTTNRGLMDATTGRIIPGSITQVSNNDDAFGIASLIAAGIVTGGVAAAGSAGGSGAGALSGMDLAADAAVGTGNNIGTAGSVFGSAGGAGAAAYPVSAGGADSSTSILGGGNTVPTAGGGVAGGSATPAASTGVGGTSVPGLDGYYTTGATQGSTYGSSLTGAGGTAGSVGSGSAAGYLQGASTLAGYGSNAKSAVDILSGLYGMNLASQAKDASDPFAQYRAGYGEQLAALMANPSSITNQPGYRAGIEAIDRSAAASGHYGSGNQKAALARYGGDFYDKTATRLAGLAGANVTPGNGAFQAANLTGQSLASIGYGLSRYFGS